MEPSYSTKPGSSKDKLTLSLNLRLLVIILLVVILAMLVLWRPWQADNTSERTISITGEATLKAEPDQYIFSPAYDFTNADKNTAIASLTKKSDEIIAKVKELGVADSKIKSNASDYGSGRYYVVPGSESANTYTLQLTITVGSRQTAQKVQDYLLTTAPTGAITPNANFSEAKRKQLENKARDDAIKDARTKAERSAKNLDFEIGKIKSVKEGNGFGIYPLLQEDARGSTDSLVAPSAPKLNVQPGENELQYSVTVVYFIR